MNKNHKQNQAENKSKLKLRANFEFLNLKKYTPSQQHSFIDG